MTDYAIYKALPAQERDELGFVRWRELQRVGTHGPDCWSWGPRHYDCAMQKIEELCHELMHANRNHRTSEAISAARREDLATLTEAALAVVVHWDTPSWQSDEHPGEVITRLRDVLEAQA